MKILTYKIYVQIWNEAIDKTRSFLSHQLWCKLAYNFGDEIGHQVDDKVNEFINDHIEEL